MTQGYCSAYCDIYDNLIPGWYCDQWSVPVYCCGTPYNKTCCTDPSAEINVDEETVCGHSWIYYQWSLIYGLVAVLMVVLMVIICCICCRGYQIVSRRNQTTASRQERGGDVEPDSHSIGFDPSCEYAFEPPRYETLPKDPPKYSEVFTTSEHENAAFVPEEQPLPLPPFPLATTTEATTAAAAAATTAPSTMEELSVSASGDVTVQRSGPSSPSPSSSSSSSSSGNAEPEANRSCQAEVTITIVEETGNERRDRVSTSSL